MQPTSLYFLPLNKIKEKMKFKASCQCLTNAGKKTTWLLETREIKEMLKTALLTTACRRPAHPDLDN